MRLDAAEINDLATSPSPVAPASLPVGFDAPIPAPGRLVLFGHPLAVALIDPPTNA